MQLGKETFVFAKFFVQLVSMNCNLAFKIWRSRLLNNSQAAIILGTNKYNDRPIQIYPFWAKWFFND